MNDGAAAQIKSVIPWAFRTSIDLPKMHDHRIDIVIYFNPDSCPIFLDFVAGPCQR